MRHILASAALLLALACAACGSVSPTIDAGSHDDAGPTIDANPNAPDAGVDAAVTPTGRPGTDLATAGGRISGGGYTVDVEVGLPIHQGPAGGGGNSVEGGAAIKP